MTNIYESDLFRSLSDGSMHPGGLRLTDRAVRLADLHAGMRLADIGCGTGTTASYLAGKYNLNVVGLEISDKLIDLGLKNHPGLNLIRWDCESLPFEQDSLDAIVFECTLSVLGNTENLLSQCAKALKKGGTVIISDLCTIKEDTGLMTPTQLHRLLSSAGFDVLLQEDHRDALRTYAAELRTQNNNSLDACFLDGLSCGLAGIRLSSLGYMLTIARK